MSDRGEKIVNLAREMLRSEVTIDPPEQASQTAISFKVLCFATLLAAAGSSAVTQWANEAQRPITRYEKVELDALVFYAARLKGTDEETLRREIENRVGVDDFGEFTERDYRAAKSWLQDKIR